ncbi:MAG TPA: hypothetical protein VKA02_06540 [Candidatus Acidoferrum sp.]|nr:hypothetical protein [Candidatus Acidoferrum sp.]
MGDELQPEGASNLWLKRFELLILRPLDLCLVIAAVVSLFHKDWWFGSFLLFVGFFVGTVGQGLAHHRQQNARELRRGLPTPSEVFQDAPEGRLPEEIAPSESYEMAIAGLKTTCVLALVTVVTLVHLDYRWYTTAVASGLVVVGFPVFSLVIVMGTGMWSNRKNLKVAWRAKKH